MSERPSHADAAGLGLEDVRLDHLGIAVRSLAEGATLYQALGLEVGDIEVVASQGVRVGVVSLGESRVELLEPYGEGSPIAKFLESRGPGMHHLCFRVPDLHAAMRRLSETGHRLLQDEPVPGAHGSMVCFVHPRSAGGVLIELSQPAAATGTDDR